MLDLVILSFLSNLIDLPCYQISNSFQWKLRVLQISPIKSISPKWTGFKQAKYYPQKKVRTMFSQSNMPSTTSVLSTYTTFTASAMLVRSVINEVQAMTKQLIPQQLHDKILSKMGGLLGNFSSQTILVIDETNGLSINEMFEASEIYLRLKISPSVERLKVSKAPGEKDLCVSINQGEKIMDSFEGVQLTWQMICIETQKASTDYAGGFETEIVARRSIELSFHKKYREMVLSSYLPYVLERSKAIKEENKVVKLNSYYGAWSSINLNHPSTFDTLAMDLTLKKEVIDDLDRFVKRRHFYRRVGKAWKRGYLLYGPPGTGKSSLIAAMANYLKFHIYDLELTSLRSDAELRRHLISTANQSILVIEDIDCSSNFQNRQAGGYNNGDSQVTLSGLLNFIDGLWSSCGDEKIIIFTTNHKDRLDPALLRPGRMDMHIHMSYCTPCGFKILASNYLSINNHSMFSEIEKLVTEVEVTPAEIAEELMKSDEADIALGGLIKFLHKKKTEHDKANAEEEKEDSENGEEVSEQAKECPGNKRAENKTRKTKGKAKKGRIRR
ncbi:AAA-ATPase At3g50940-like [Camellia sinensis]|uniref:AAA-ATPase At3g50940-like n=1 Tax=Camellia sinensis TaxID=4442 RepID=UPI001035B48B|nr:AAA-ATPase At3g50940-like [Camellia sinensis]